MSIGLAALCMSAVVASPSGGAHAPKSEPVLPTSGSWLERTFSVSILNQPGLAQGNPIPPSPSYEETITGTLRTWVNSTTECAGATFNPVSFGNADAAISWKQAGFTTSPLSAAVEGICQEPGSGLDSPPSLAELPSNGMTPIDVSSLPLNPSRLARELVRGKTGSQSVDQKIEQAGASTQGFERAVLLLLAPRSGDSLAFRMALLHAIAKLPGVHALGTVTTHSGVRGEAFAGDSGADAESVVVSRTTGQLLEIRNMESYPWALAWLGVTLTSFDPYPYAMSNLFYPPIVSEMHLTAQWIDVASPVTVGKSSVPSTLRFLASA